MAITLRDVELSVAMNILFALIFWQLKDNKTAQQIYKRVQWFWIIQLVIAFVPDSMSILSLKPLKLFVSYGFGFDFFLLSAKWKNKHLAWRWITNLNHHLTVLCNDSWLEMIGYSICWTVHLFPYAKYLGGYDTLTPLWTLGNHIPFLIFLQYGYYYYVVGDTLDDLSFFVCVHMVLYRYIFSTAKFRPYGLMKIEPFKTYIKQTTKALIIICTAFTVLRVRFGLIIIICGGLMLWKRPEQRKMIWDW